MKGYVGRLLVVNLTEGSIKEEPLKEDYARGFLGGSGLSARYIYEMVEAETDPLGPDNPLVFMTGPLVGTPAPSCGRYVVCSRSPLTGLWGEANSGGFFGPELKFSGYDGIIIKGKSEEPVYLWIREGEAILKKAAHLWGKDTYETQASIKEELGDERIRVACVGKAGEKLVKFASVMNDDGRAAGRTGMGAVMGSKRLKAIAVRGKKDVPLADPEGFKRASEEVIKLLKESFATQVLREMGTANIVDIMMMLGDMPSKYFTQGYFEGAEKISGATMSETILKRRFACYRCPIGCGRKVDLSARFDVADVDGPEYETIAAYGSLLLSDDLEAIAYVGHLCNRYGLDTISAGSTIALAYYLYEKGIIGKDETGGLELAWGEVETAIKLTEMIAERDGFGDLLAEGSRELARRYGAEGLAVEVNGLEVPMHDPRASFGMALTYATSPRGACHNQADMYLVDLVGMELEEVWVISGKRFDSSAEKARVTALLQNWRSVYNAMIMCHFSNPPAHLILELLRRATGWELSIEELMKIGERIFNLKRSLNIKFGLSAADDRLPNLLLLPLSEGGAAGEVPDIELLLKEFYSVRGWDPESGRPGEEKLKELGLGQLAEDLWK